MTHLETRSYQKTRAELRFDHKLVTSLQILQMPVKELEPFLEEKLILNPLIPLETLKAKELLLEDLGISIEDSAIDPKGEETFWKALLQNETEKSPFSEEMEEVGDLFSPVNQIDLPIPLQKGKEHEIDLFIFFCKSKWRVLCIQPYEYLIEKALREPRCSIKEHARFLKDLKTFHYALASRKTLLSSIGMQIALHWNSLFQNGDLIPLSINEIATLLNRHRTTILRAIRNKKCFTPHGIFSLENFFEGTRAKKARLCQKKVNN